ncbi:MAG TPA: 6-phosphogluconolactonase [Actinotalea caeni]|uniref:6-phosphogluconolactonase n=1 Tax=Actinotalea caeni TaxID=1348467 RepID=UPI0012E2C707|nr:6-phosphogluconolactonase [Actinotalea caeni]HLV56883.1 6-phosphogluconolactonase [Actinotalea caeni]
MSDPRPHDERAVVVHPDGDAVARATAARLLLALLDAQALRRPVHVAVTGGTVGTKVLAETARSELRDLVDWTGVHVWWGDERYVAPDSDDRNEKQAREALLDALPLPAENIHPFPADDGTRSLEEAAAAFADELAAHAPDGARWPVLDVTLLGVGPDGHVASLFPGKESLGVTDRAVVAEPDSPKPPPARLSLTLPVLDDSRQVWFVVAGADKAEAVTTALAGGDLPAARVRGQDVTLWLLDAAAAGADAG